MIKLNIELNHFKPVIPITDNVILFVKVASRAGRDCWGGSSRQRALGLDAGRNDEDPPCDGLA